jgi:hypothetical protein
MIPQRQTIFVADNPKGRGNCQQAAMASVLELPLDEVIDTTSDEVRDGGFWPPIYRWLADRGLKMVSVSPKDARLKGQYSIGSGPSPRGKFWHAIICKNGRMVFDPHPSDDGLKRIMRHDLIVPMTDVEIKMHAAWRDS